MPYSIPVLVTFIPSLIEQTSLLWFSVSPQDWPDGTWLTQAQAVSGDLFVDPIPPSYSHKAPNVGNFPSFFIPPLQCKLLLYHPSVLYICKYIFLCLAHALVIFPLTSTAHGAVKPEVHLNSHKYIPHGLGRSSSLWGWWGCDTGCLKNLCLPHSWKCYVRRVTGLWSNPV